MTANGKLTDTANGESTAEDRCRCDKPRNPAKPDHCLGGHWMTSNTGRGKSIDRKMREQDQQARIIEYRDQYLRDLDWTPDRAPLHTVHYCQFLAEALVTVENVRQSKHAAREVAALLPKVQRLYSLFETFRRKKDDNEWGEKPLEQHLADLRQMRVEVETLIDATMALIEHEHEVQRERETRLDQSAVPETHATPGLPTLTTRANSDFPANGSGSTVPTVAGKHRAPDPIPTPARYSSGSLRPSSPASRPDSDAEPEPVLYAYGKRITESDVTACLRDSGDIEAYQAGRISKERAYEMTRRWLRQLMEMR